MSRLPSSPKFKEIADTRSSFAAFYRSLWGSEESDLKDSMKNLALASGSLAVGSLVVVGVLKIPSIPFIVGIMLCLLACLAAFAFTFDKHDSNMKSILKNKQIYLDPIDRALVAFLDEQDGKISTPERDKIVEEYDKHFRDMLLKSRDKNLTDSEFTLSSYQKVLKGLAYIFSSIGTISIFVGLGIYLLNLPR